MLDAGILTNLNKMKTGIELIAEERQRQIQKEGWTSEHDDEHIDGEIAIAAATYAIRPIINEVMLNDEGIPHLWPWEAKCYKPTPENRIRELQKAGALIAAEIDRLQRS
jgi:hypothetical protein